MRIYRGVISLFRYSMTQVSNLTDNDENSKQSDKHLSGARVMNLKKYLVPYRVSKQKGYILHILEKLSTLQTVHELVNDYLFLKQYNEVVVQNINTISPIAPAIASGRTKEFWEYCSFTSFLSEVIVDSMSAVDVLLVESISAVDVLLFSGDQTMYRRGICSADCTETHRHRHSESPHMAISLKNIQ